MSKEITYGFDALQKLQNGITKLSSAVKITLGPKGQNVVLDRELEDPLITNDGVTIAKAISLPDKIENMGAKLLKSVSIKTNDLAGDGTTTACVLAESMITEGIKNYMAGAHPLLLRSGMQKAVEAVCTYLDNIAIVVDNKEKIKQIATISAGSEEVGTLISDAFDKIGLHGTITLADSKTTKTECQVVEGLSFDRGYLSPYFCNVPEKMQVELDSPYILLSYQPIHKIQEILPAIEEANQKGKSLCIITNEIEENVLQTLVINKLRGALNVAVVKAPEFGDRQRAYLEDIAVLTNGQVLASDSTYSFSAFDISCLGTCQKITITQDSTTLVGGSPDSERMTKRIQSIEYQIQNATNPFDKAGLEERLSKLCGGIAVIRVGGYTDVEQNELKLRIEDSIHATKSATLEGIVPGGGIALLTACKVVEELIKTLDGDEKTGASIILHSLTAPLKQICTNAHVDSGVILDKIQHSKLAYAGYDAKNDEIVDMFASGIIDPKKVTRCALQNACSVASTLLTTQVVISEKE